MVRTPSTRPQLQVIERLPAPHPAHILHNLVYYWGEPMSWSLRVLGTISLFIVALLATDQRSFACDCDPDTCLSGCYHVKLKGTTLNTLHLRDRQTLKSGRSFIMTTPSGEKFHVTPLPSKQ
jgi:hypothetical protein